jgi:RNA polymerase sigma-70 factor, ECF subfamily
MPFRFGGDDEKTRPPQENLASDDSRFAQAIHQPVAAGWKGLSDEELATQLANGQHDALTELFERYSELVFGIARRMLKDNGEAEEALQQVFLDMYRAIDQFDVNKAPYRTWLLQFVYHRTINRKRHLERKGFYSSEEFDEELLSLELCGSPSRPLQLSTPEVVHLIGQLLGTIKAPQRRTIELTFFDGLTAEEIAAQTGETVDVVRHNLYRGLKKLRSALHESTRCERSEKTGKVEGIIFAHPRSL